MEENVSAIIQHKLLQKYKDLGTFTIPCIIGNQRIERAMFDLGASINVMPYSIYASLKLDPLKQTEVIIQLADQSNAYPKGVIEDALVKINNLIFLTDFYVLYMKDDASLNPSPILLGRPFLKTSKTKIDVDKGTLTMEFDGELTEFDIFKKPIKNHALSPVNIVNFVLQVPSISEVAIKADEQRKKTLFHKPNFKAKSNGGRSLTTEKKLKERKVYKLKSNLERTNYST